MQKKMNCHLEDDEKQNETILLWYHGHIEILLT